MQSLRRVLLDEYRSFADRRIKRIEKGHLFIVDDRTHSDFAADGSLFLWFCTIHADVLNDTAVQLMLQGGIPMSPRVAQWIDDVGAEYTTSKFDGAKLYWTIQRGEQRSVNELASAIRAITAPGSSYPVAAYKYVCPRTAASLERLAATLSLAWPDTSR